jgi:hypothetical protein
LPPSMINVPYWLTVDNIDDIAENMDAYNEMHKTFFGRAARRGAEDHPRA